MDLRKGDCLEVLKTIDDKSIDFVYLDLPFGQTGCSWDRKLDLTLLWKELKRIAKNDRTPFFFSCTTKFGYELIKSNEKYFRWDLVWEKNKRVGFLNAYKLPLRAHEMVYCFAKKSPEYDVSSHLTGEEIEKPPSNNHKFIMEASGERKGRYLTHKSKVLSDPLPTSVLPTQDHELVYCFAKKLPEYDVSSHLTGEEIEKPPSINDIYLMEAMTGRKGSYKKSHMGKVVKDPLPTSVLDIPSSWCYHKLDEKINHRTSKPVSLMEFLLKYWTKEGWTVLDPTMGSGSMGVACKRMNRKFIGIEKDDDIFELAKKRIEDEKK